MARSIIAMRLCALALVYALRNAAFSFTGLHAQSDLTFIGTPAAPSVVFGRMTLRTLNEVVLGKLEAVGHNAVPPLYSEKQTILSYPKEWYPGEIYAAEEAEDIAMEISVWFHRVGMVRVPLARKAFNKIKIDPLGGPSRRLIGQSREGAVLVTKFIVAFCVYDNFVEMEAQRGSVMTAAIHIHKVLDLLLGGTAAQCESKASEDPYLAMWADVFQTIANVKGEGSEFNRRFVAVAAKLLEALCEELNIIQASPSNVNISDLIRVRSASVGASVAIVLVEAATLTSLPTDVWWRPETQRMLELLDMCVRVANEIASAPKDLLEGEGNVIDAIVEQQSCPPDEAVEVLNAMHGDIVREFDQLANQLLIEYELDEAASSYISAMRRFTALINHWFSMSPRYTAWTLLNHTESTYSALRVRFAAQ